MRKRAIFAGLVVATALGGFVVPAAYADETVGDIQITDVTVNGGKSIAVGLADKTITMSVTATDPSGIWDADFHLWRGTDPDNPDGYIKPNEDTTPADCVASSATTATCSKTFTFEPDWWLANADAGTWKVGVQAWANDDSRTQRDAYTNTRIQRYSKLTVNMRPGAGGQGQDPHGHRQAHPGELGHRRLRGLHRTARQAPVPPGGHQHVHHRQDGEHLQHR